MDSTQQKAAKFHWGHGVIIYFSAFVIFMVVMVVMASKQDFDLVTDDYYAQEIAYQKDIDARHNNAALAQPATISLDEKAKILAVHIPIEVAPQEGEIYLFRPSGTALDKKYRLEVDAEGGQFIDVSGITKGAYDVHMTWASGGVQYKVNQRIIIP